MTQVMEVSSIISSLRTKQEAASLGDNGENLRCQGGLQVVHLGGQDLTLAIPVSKGQSPHQLNNLCGCFHGQCLQLSCLLAAWKGTPWIPKKHACVPMCVLGDWEGKFNEDAEIHQYNYKCNSMCLSCYDQFRIRYLPAGDTNSVTFKINQNETSSISLLMAFWFCQHIGTGWERFLYLSH